MFLHSRFLPSLLKNSGLKHSRAADTLSGTHPPAGELQPLLLPLQVQWVENIPQFGCFGLRCWHSGCFLLGLPKGFAPLCLGVFVPCYTQPALSIGWVGCRRAEMVCGSRNGSAGPRRCEGHAVFQVAGRKKKRRKLSLAQDKNAKQPWIT